MVAEGLPSEAFCCAEVGNVLIIAPESMIANTTLTAVCADNRTILSSFVKESVSSTRWRAKPD